MIAEAEPTQNLRKDEPAGITHLEECTVKKCAECARLKAQGYRECSFCHLWQGPTSTHRH